MYQSKYQFFYDDKLAALPVENVKVNNASIEDALNVILKGKDISLIILSLSQESLRNEFKKKKQKKLPKKFGS